MAYAGQCRVSFPVRLGAHVVMRLLAGDPYGPRTCSVAPRGMIGVWVGWIYKVQVKSLYVSCRACAYSHFDNMHMGLGMLLKVLVIGFSRTIYRPVTPED